MRQQFTGVGDGGGGDGGAGEEAGQLVDALLGGEAAEAGGAGGILGDEVVSAALGGDLGEVGDGENLHRLPIVQIIDPILSAALPETPLSISSKKSVGIAA